MKQKVIFGIICVTLAISASACKMPERWSKSQCQAKAVRMFQGKYGKGGKLTIIDKTESDGYEFNITNGKKSAEIDCGFYGYCEFDQ